MLKEKRKERRERERESGGDAGEKGREGGKSLLFERGEKIDLSKLDFL